MPRLLPNLGRPQRARVARALGMVAAMFLPAIVNAACSSEGNTQNAPLADGVLVQPNNSSSLSGTEPCVVGTSRVCSETLGAHDGVLSCYHGVAYCEGSSWGPCVEGHEVALVLDEVGQPGRALQALSSVADCVNNPCDPSCQVFDEVPDAPLGPDPGVLEPEPTGGDESSLPGGFGNKLFKDINHPPMPSACTAVADCQADHYCDLASGACEPYAVDEVDACGGANFTIGIPCDGYLPVCNRGDVASVAGLEVHVISGNSSQLQSNLGDCTPSGGSLAGTCVINQAIQPGECVNAADCIPLLSGTKGLAVNLATYGATQAECDCADNWSVSSTQSTSAACLTSPGPVAPLEESQVYEAECPEDQRVQWGFVSYETNLPYNDVGQPTVTLDVHVADDQADLQSDCSDCVRIADIPTSEPESCPMVGGPAGCPLDLYTALDGNPDAHKSVLELVWTLTPSDSGGPSIFFEEDFEDNSQGWTLDTEWEIGAATASSGETAGNPDPASDVTSTSDDGIAGVAIGDNAALSVHGWYYLTSPVIFLDHEEDITLEYNRWLNSDYSPYMENKVEVFDGTGWVEVWATGDAPGVEDAAWQVITHDVTAYKNASFQVRFGFMVGDLGLETVSSWNIDDVTLYAEDSAQALPRVLSWQVTHSCVDAQ